MKGPQIPVVNLEAQYETIREEIQAAMAAVLAQGSFILGPEVEALEQQVAAKQGCAYGIGCASGSDAILLSLLALGIGPGDGVLVPSFTFFSTAGAVARVGARPLFVDIDPRTFNINPAAVEEALRKPPDRAVVKAIVPVHLYGQCPEMDRLLALAGQSHLPVIEDAAQAVLARYRGRAVGSLGLAGCFSFYPTKNLGGFGDGGMITTNDAAFADRLRLWRSHGSSDKRVFTHLGINSRLDTLQAAVLLVKLRRLDEWTRLRRQKAAVYRETLLNTGLSNPEAVHPTTEAPIVLPYEMPGAMHVYHQFTVRALRRDELANYLADNGIESAIYYPTPLHRQPAFAYLGLSAGACPESERAAREVLSLPLYPELIEEQQVRVVQQIKSFYFS